MVFASGSTAADLAKAVPPITSLTKNPPFDLIVLSISRFSGRETGASCTDVISFAKSGRNEIGFGAGT